MGLFSSLFVLTVLRDVALLLAVIAFAWRPAALPVVALTTWTAVAVPVAALLATALGFWNARRTAAVVRVDLETFSITRTFSLEGHWPVQLIARRGPPDRAMR